MLAARRHEKGSVMQNFKRALLLSVSPEMLMHRAWDLQIPVPDSIEEVQFAFFDKGGLMVVTSMVHKEARHDGGGEAHGIFLMPYVKKRLFLED
jgi:hypothetical protein